MFGITRRLRRDSSLLIRDNNRSNDKCRMHSMTSKRRGKEEGAVVVGTMSVLASYLLIFTVVSSLGFVNSQPVTNLPARSNKLTPAPAPAPTSNSPRYRPSTSSSTSSFSDFGKEVAVDGEGGNADVVFVSSSTFTAFTGEREEDIVSPPQHSQPIPGTKDENKKELLNQLERPNEIGGRDEEGASSNKPNNDDDVDDNEDDVVSLMTTERTNKKEDFFPEKIRNGLEQRGRERERMARDKDKVMVTDDVRESSSSGISFSPNLETSRTPETTTTTRNGSRHNANFGSAAPRRSTTVMESGSSINLKFEEGDVNSKANTTRRRKSNTTSIPTSTTQQPFRMDWNKSSDGILSTGQKYEVTRSPDAVLLLVNTTNNNNDEDVRSENANVVNNHANFTRGEGFSVSDMNDVDKVDGDKESYHPRHLLTTSTRFNVTSRKGKIRGGEGEDGDNGNSSSDSSSPSGNLKSRRDVRKMNSSKSFALDKNKEGRKLNERRKVEEKGGEEKEQQIRDYHHNSAPNYDSTLKKEGEAKEEAAAVNPEGKTRTSHPYHPSSPLLMNKWIKTVVEFSECLANCMDDDDDEDSSFHSQSPSSSSTPLTTEAVDTVEGVSSPHYPPPSTAGSSSTTSTTSPPQSSERGNTGGIMPHGTMKNRTEQANPSPAPTLYSLLETSSNSPTIPTIKVTRSKSMKYYELPSCQDECRLKYPLHGKSNVSPSEQSPASSASTVAAAAPTAPALNDDARNGNADYVVPTSKTGLTSSRKQAGGEELITTTGIKNGANKGNKFGETTRRRTTTTSPNPFNGNNGNNNNSNIELYVAEPLENWGKAGEGEGGVDRKSNNNQSDDDDDDDDDRDRDSPGLQGEQQHYHHYLPSETVKEPLHPEEKPKEGNKKEKSDEMKRNKKFKTFVGGGSEGNGKLLGIGEEGEDGRLNNLKIFEERSEEARLKVRQLFPRKKGTRSGSRSSSIQMGSSILLELSWPKPWENEGNHVFGTSGNNNRGAEAAFFSAQVKDKKGIDEERNEKEGNQRARKGKEEGETTTTTPVVYSIILEESWIGSGGYARRWKLIDQMLSQNTATVQISLFEETRKNNNIGASKLNVPPAEVKRGNQEELLESGAAMEFEDEMGKVVEVKKEKIIMVKLDKSPLVGASNPPSKVTLHVFAVTKKKGLEKVYFARLNNSYYHLSERDHHDHEEKAGGVKEDQMKVNGEYPNPNQPHQKALLFPAHQGSNTGDGQEDGRVNTKFSNEGEREEKGREEESAGIFLRRDHRKVFLDGEGKKKKKVSGWEGKPDMSDGSNENSNKILTFPSEESLSRTMKGLSGERRVKKLMSRLRAKSITTTTTTRGKSDLMRKAQGNNGGLNGSEWKTNELKMEKDMMTDSGNKSDWGLHLVSMVYQKFLVVTQISWDFPGEDNVNYEGNDEDQHHNISEKKLNLGEEKAQDKKNKKVKSLSSSDGEKLRGCGDGGGASGVDTKLNFLLSWEIFGGGLRGNLVTDTCSASISLWPDTVYIIQVGLISPGSMRSKTSPSNEIPSGTKYDLMEAFEEDVDEIAVASTAWKRSNNNNNNRKGKYILGSGDGDNNGNPPPPPKPSSSDPLALPESIPFPFEGEPKVTIKSERILVNTTRVGGNDNNNGAGLKLRRNQDKISLGIPKSNNNFLMGKDEEGEVSSRSRMMIMSTFYERKKKSESIDDDDDGGTEGEGRKNFDNASSSDSSPVSGGSGISEGMNVTPIQMMGNDGKDGHKNGHVVALNDQPEAALVSTAAGEGKVAGAAAAGENEEEGEEDDEKDASSVWDDEDDDETSDQDESLFARSMAHHHLKRPMSEAQAQMQRAGSTDKNLRNGNDQHHHPITTHDSLSNTLKDSDLSKKVQKFLTVNGFYHNLYALNALEVSNRYPNVVSLNNGGPSTGGGGGRDAISKTVGDSSAIPLLIGEFSHSNGSSKYLYGTGTDVESEDDSDSIQGKLYTLFVVLVISFVVFLFVVAVVGFCVLTSSIKENYKYFVPKKVRVWTTMNQLLSGQRSSTNPGTSAAGNGGELNGSSGGRGGVKDSSEGSFYPQRLQEEPDFEFEDEFGQDDEEEEELSSVPETEDEDLVELEDGECGGGCCCCCSCSSCGGSNNEVNLNENSFALNERRDSILPTSSDTTTLIKAGEEASVELMAAPTRTTTSPQSSSSSSSQRFYSGESSFVSGATTATSPCNRNSSSGCKSNENCDNNNPCYHTAPPGGQGSCVPHQSTQTSSASKASSTVSAAISSLKKNFHLRRSKKERNKQQQQQQHYHHPSHQHQLYNHHHPHHHHHHHHPHCPKSKSDVRIEVGSYNSRARGLATQRQEGYY